MLHTQTDGMQMDCSVHKTSVNNWSMWRHPANDTNISLHHRRSVNWHIKKYRWCLYIVTRHTAITINSGIPWYQHLKIIYIWICKDDLSPWHTVITAENYRQKPTKILAHVLCIPSFMVQFDASKLVQKTGKCFLDCASATLLYGSRLSYIQFHTRFHSTSRVI